MKTDDLLEEKIAGTGTFVQGFNAVFSSFRVVSEHRGLLKYFIVPFLLNIIILSSIFYFSYTTIEPWLSGLVDCGSWICRVLQCLIAPLLILVLGLLTILIYSVAGSIITAPFNDFLSMGVEKRITGAAFDEPFSIAALFDDVRRITANTVKLLFLLLGVNILLIVINVIPFLGNFIYSVLSFLSTAFFLGFQFFDFPLERRRLGFGDKMRIAWRYRMMVCGLGAGFFIISWIPLAGFLGLNAGTIGATVLFIDHIRPCMVSREGGNIRSGE